MPSKELQSNDRGLRISWISCGRTLQGEKGQKWVLREPSCELIEGDLGFEQLMLWLEALLGFSAWERCSQIIRECSECEGHCRPKQPLVHN